MPCRPARLRTREGQTASGAIRERWGRLLSQNDGVRQRWIETLASSVASATRVDPSILDQLDKHVSTPRLGSATACIYVATRYQACENPDSIKSSLNIDDFNLRLTENELLDRLIVPCCLAFRNCRLPTTRWWDARRAFVTLLEFFVRERLQLSNAKQVRRELESIWDIKSRAVQNSFLDGAALPLEIESVSATAPHLSAESQDLIAAATPDPHFVKATQCLVSGQGEMLSPRPDLMNLLWSIELREVIRESLGEGIDSAVTDEMMAHLDKLGDTQRGLVKRLTLEEMDLVTSTDPDTALLHECVEVHRTIRIVELMHERSLPDSIHDCVEIPAWALEYIHLRGGRIRTTSVGATPYLMALITPSDLAEETRISSTEEVRIGLSIQGNEVALLLLLRAPDAEEIVVPFRYRLEHGQAVADLALALAAEYVRLDLFSEDDAGVVQYLVTRCLPLSDAFLDPAREALLRVVRESFAGSATVVRDNILNEQIKGFPAAGFLTCDAAKSHGLLVDLEHTASTAAPLEDEVEPGSPVVAARRDLLSAWIHEAALIADQGEGEEDFDNYIRSKESDYVVAQQRASAGQEDTALRDKLDVLAPTLGSPSRAFVHFTFSDGYLGAFWCQPDQDTCDFGFIDLGDWNLASVITQLSAWLSAHVSRQEDALDEVLFGLGRYIASRLVSILEPRGVRDLILSPISVLEMLPIHCAPVADENYSQLLVDRFSNVSYAPSVRILAGLHHSDRPAPERSVAISYSPPRSPLPFANAEVELIAELLESVETRSGASATPEAVMSEASRARLIHLACHGIVDIERPLVSRLVLFGNTRSAGHLSAARILRDGDFRGTRLVTLAGCETGVGYGGRSRMTTYAGLDGAFLARGARAALSTLWPVRDVASLVFMSVFYRSLGNEERVAQAYGEAVSHFRQESPPLSTRISPQASILLDQRMPDWRDHVDDGLTHPLHWGAFKLTGLTWT
jgi:CHAT domain-containing protein